ncbi:unnamed protein product [Gongylonema pulchrum]|uniref:Peptidase C1A papain C-terminal domain-containing protein n=1 Tax=Gongylonema pulchrum TaxID=637853 RepID=A0A3P7MCM1_9BILA|nr:unnamed protein product [Gongylonema pulchrum]
MIQENLLLEIQKGRYTWTGRNYSKFWGQTLEDGVRYRLGTLFPERSVQNMNQIIVKPRELPTRFDAREKWPDFIHPVQDQGNYRLAIITDGRLNTPLSAQQLLSCNQHRQKGCEGGYLDRAWWYIRKLGVVSEECYPYVSGQLGRPEPCRIQKSDYRTGRPLRCPSGHPNAQIYRMTPSYRVSSKEEDIMSEIMTNGPVQATFLVHDDFFMYSSGIYQRLPMSSGRAQDWGENGTFRILRGENHCEIESFVIGAWGKDSKARHRLLKIRKQRKHLRAA